MEVSWNDDVRVVCQVSELVEFELELNCQLLEVGWDLQLEFGDEVNQLEEKNQYIIKLVEIGLNQIREKPLKKLMMLCQYVVEYAISW